MLKIIEKIGSHGAICECVVCKNTYKTLDRFSSEKQLVGAQCEACKHLPNNPPTQLMLLQVLNYDMGTGVVTYKRDFHGRKKGDIATFPHSGGYLNIKLDKQYLAHHVIWMLMTGVMPEFIDHENHVRDDNRWSNLRDVDRQANAVNKSLNVNNKTGYIGVSFMSSRKKFRATITVERKSMHLGLFDTAELAYAARLQAEERYGFHSNHGDKPS